MTSTLHICAFVVLFRVLAALAPAGLPAMGLGMLEMVTGIAALEPGRAGFIAAQLSQNPSSSSASRRVIRP